MKLGFNIISRGVSPPLFFSLSNHQEQWCGHTKVPRWKQYWYHLMKGRGSFYSVK